MKKLLVLQIILLMATVQCSAQARQSPEIEALGQKLMVEINAVIQCNANAITGRNEIERLQAELKALKAKYEPEEKK